MALTPNMNLNLPVPGVTPGPEYAAENNTAFQAIDAHNHTTGQGAPVPTAGLLINSDLSFNGNNATQLRSVRLNPQNGQLTNNTDVNALYSDNGDLVYVDGQGNQVQITIGGAIDVSTAGNISGMEGTSAAVVYIPSTSTYKFLTSPSVSADVDAAAINIRNTSSENYAITLGASTALAANYSLTLPPSIPSPSTAQTTGKVVAKSDSAGNITFDTSFVPAGAIMPFAGATAPDGWVPCDGSTYTRVGQYANLFAAIGTNWGHGDGSTTFNVPDLRGQFLRGITGSAGTDPDAASRTAINTGGATGNNVGSAQGSQFGSHNHPININDPGHNHTSIIRQGTENVGTGTNGSVAGIWFSNGADGSAATSTSGTGISASSNSVGGSESRPVNAYVLYIIKF